MKKITQITSNPLQKQNLILDDGTQVQVTIYYVPLQFGWFITELVYGDFILRGVRICNSPNMLYQFKNQIPFGIACYTEANREPTQQQDFASGAAILYLLSQAEVDEYAEFLSGQV